MAYFNFKPDSPNVYSEQLRIRSYHTDIRRRLTIPKLCSFFQEIAGNHTVACGVGWEVLQQNNLFWVLSRLKIEVGRYPEWQELITVRTWSNGLDGLFAIRNFQVLDQNGTEMIRAISSWLMVNAETRRLCRADPYMEGFPLCDDRLFDENPDKLPALNPTQSFGSSGVNYTETDMNMHMNNVCYIERIINSFEFAFLEQHEIDRFEISFLKEAVMGNQLQVVRQELGNRLHLGAIVSEDGQTEYVRTAMNWRSL